MKPDDPMKGRCTATNRQGRRCGKWPIQGGTVCRLHGGAAPQVIAKAQERLDRLADGPAIEALAELVSPQMVKQFPSTALGASRYLVDRKHGMPTERVEVTDTTGERLEQAREAARRRNLPQGAAAQTCLTRGEN